MYAKYKEVVNCYFILLCAEVSVGEMFDNGNAPVAPCQLSLRRSSRYPVFGTLAHIPVSICRCCMYPLAGCTITAVL